MAAVKSRNTRPELLVRKYLFSRGLRYRVNNRSLPGSPDIVLRKYRTVIFIDGCFWHGHKGCKFFRLPTTNTVFWRHKIAMNYARDIANNTNLSLAGWRVIRIWECEIKTKSEREATLEKLYHDIVNMELTKVPGKLKTSVPDKIPSPDDVNPYADYLDPVGSEDMSIAAEPEAIYGFSNEKQ